MSAAGVSARPGWLSSELYPFETKRLAGLNHIDQGSGPTLLFVHGNPTWSFLYREIVRGLMDDFRCIAVDLPGFGLSEPPEGFRFTPLEQALELERVDGRAHVLVARGGEDALQQGCALGILDDDDRLGAPASVGHDDHGPPLIDGSPGGLSAWDAPWTAFA